VWVGRRGCGWFSQKLPAVDGSPIAQSKHATRPTHTRQTDSTRSGCKKKAETAMTRATDATKPARRGGRKTARSERQEEKAVQTRSDRKKPQRCLQIDGLRKTNQCSSSRWQRRAGRKESRRRLPNGRGSSFPLRVLEAVPRWCWRWVRDRLEKQLRARAFTTQIKANLPGGPLDAARRSSCSAPVALTCGGARGCEEGGGKGGGCTSNAKAKQMRAQK
jgi:hypothetical protein